MHRPHSRISCKVSRAFLYRRTVIAVLSVLLGQGIIDAYAFEITYDEKFIYIRAQVDPSAKQSEQIVSTTGGLGASEIAVAKDAIVTVSLTGDKTIITMSTNASNGQPCVVFLIDKPSVNGTVVNTTYKPIIDIIKNNKSKGFSVWRK